MNNQQDQAAAEELYATGVDPQDNRPGQPKAPVDPFSLEAVCSSRKWTAQKFIVYGVPGVGKTTFASTFPAPILLKFEEGANALDVPCFPSVAASCRDFSMAVDALEKGQHSFQTLILDSLDWLEPIVWAGVCQKNKKQNIEDFGYGRGYVLADTAWRWAVEKLDGLRIRRGMNICCICHAAAVNVEQPDCDSYQMWNLKLHKRASAIWTEWADSILFLNFKKNIVAASDNGKGKAYGNGDRVIYAATRPAYMAKSRWPLPPEIFIGQDLGWNAFHEHLAEASGGLYRR